MASPSLSFSVGLPVSPFLPPALPCVNTVQVDRGQIELSHLRCHQGRGQPGIVLQVAPAKAARSTPCSPGYTAGHHIPDTAIVSDTSTSAIHQTDQTGMGNLVESWSGSVYHGRLLQGAFPPRIWDMSRLVGYQVLPSEIPSGFYSPR